jgi:flavorubredoxin
VALLKVLIVYDSVSVNRNTEKVAEVIRDVLKTKKMDVQSVYVEKVESSTVKDYDCLIVGSPTHGRRATPLIRGFLDGLKAESFVGKSAAAFDTRFKSWWAGGAIGGIESRLRNLGFKIVLPGLVAYVGGKMSTPPVLVAGELDKAKKFAEDLSKALQ